MSTAPALTRSASRLHRLRGPLLTGAVVGGLTLALHLRDPHTAGSWGFCPWVALTGTYCPGCGGLRAVNDLSNGDVLAAASSNLLFVLAVPVLVGWWLLVVRRAWSASPPTGGVAPARTTRTRLLLIAAAALLAVAFAVLRNLPAGSWLAP